MKKRFTGVIAFCTVLALTCVSCTGNKASGKKEAKTVESVMLWQNGSLWNKNSEDKMVYVRSVPQGTVLNAVFDDSSKNFVETKNFIRISGKDESERTFVHVKFDDEFYWVQESFILVNARPAVVVTDAVTYNEAESTAINSKLKVKQGTVVAVSNVDFKDEYGTSFAKIAWHDGKNLYNSDIFVKDSDVSKELSDVYIVQIDSALKTAKNLVVKSELLDSLFSLSAYSDYAREIVNNNR